MELNDYLKPQVQEILDHLYTEESDGIEEVRDDGELYFQMYQKAEAMFALDVALKILERTSGGIADFRQELWRLWQHGSSDLQRSLAEAALQVSAASRRYTTTDGTHFGADTRRIRKGVSARAASKTRFKSASDTSSGIKPKT